MLTATALKTFLAARDLRLRKRLGQHHLVDAQVMERLGRLWRLGPGDTVVEIGAGLGALTETLAAQAGRVMAVEVDPAFARALAERLSGAPNLTVACQDILTFSWADAPGAVVVGAIPYRITSPILVSLARARGAIREAWLILQQEVAQRLAARPSTKAYGRLSILAQYAWRVTPALTIPRRAFFPPPAVDSVCVHLEPWPAPPVAVPDESRFFELVRAAFAQRRKTLVNCLLADGAGWGSRASLEAALQTLSLPANVRGEALSLSQFASLASALR
ncbi:MAG: ribosomal RNA small subunit methyltransferase A [Candidatus Omnitrophica bacterium]|nr:ribosomal RNA small subunit methyltransferase A [Candidatus Omnitrophota bacterium]